MEKHKVLILCTGNSCRSQMAEALINHRLGDTWQAFSAGTAPSGSVHPLALQVLNEIGIEHKGESKHINQLPTDEFDAVITVCDSAAENCPVWLRKGNHYHISFPDPAEAQGTDEEVYAVFSQVRGDIDEQIIRFLKDYEN